MLKNESETILDNGYSKLAEELAVSAGDYVKINGQEVVVDAVFKAVTDYKCYMAAPVYEKLYKGSGCNAFFIKGEPPQYDDSSDSGFYYVSNVHSLREDLTSKFSYISNYILITAVIGRIAASRGQIRLLPKEF